jgi:hypothetical protein
MWVQRCKPEKLLQYSSKFATNVTTIFTTILNIRMRGKGSTLKHGMCLQEQQGELQMEITPVPTLFSSI